MLERMLLLLALAALLFAGIVLVRGWTRAEQRRLLAQTPEPLWASLGMQPDGRPTLVAFSTPSCAACHTPKRRLCGWSSRRSALPACAW